MSQYHKAWGLSAGHPRSKLEERVSGFESVEDMVERGVNWSGDPVSGGRGVEITVMPHPVYKSGRRKWVGEYAILPTGDGRALSRTTFPNAPMGPTQETARAAAKRDAEHVIRTMRVSIPGDEPNQRRTVNLVDLIGGTA